MESSDKIELIIECSKCSLRRNKPFSWLHERHLPCPDCGAEFTVGDREIAHVEREIHMALRNFEKVSGTVAINLKLSN